MVDIQNWDEIPDVQEYDRPKPGGYIATICDYQDVDQLDQYGKGQYLKIFWDFAEGPLAGSLNDAFRRMGYWFHYGTFIRSYKLKALSFFKAFKTCLEVSNPRYTFNTRNLDAMKGKRIGIVLGEEEYRKEDGTVGTRLYVAAVRSVKAIQDGDFKVPALKKLGSPNQPAAPAPAPQRGYGSAQPAPSGYGYSQPYGGGFVPLPDEPDIPF